MFDANVRDAVALYVIGSGVPYGTYLQAQAFVGELKASQVAGSRAMTAAVQGSTSRLLASQQVLQAQNVRLTEATQDGFQQMSWDIQAATGAIQDLNATFVWGFNAILTHTGRMADALEQLLAAVKSPTKTRAYEYFDDARTAFKRGHLPDALELVNKAISGDHTSAGYKLEWRFHLLRGAIQVGTFSHPQLLDLSAGELSYLAAADYARTEDTDGAALAFLGAGWSCYCQGRLEDALVLTNNASAFRPSLGEAHYQAAKILMASGRSIEGLSRLRDALEIDPQYVLKAAADGDFQRYTQQFEAWCKDERDKARAEVSVIYKTASPNVHFWLGCLKNNVDLPLLASVLPAGESPLVDLLYSLHSVRRVVSAIDLKKETQFGASDASRAVATIPAALEVPPKLIEMCRSQSAKWPLDGHYFSFGRLLISRKELAGAKRICEGAVEQKENPLEFFALLLDAGARQHVQVMVDDLHRRPAASRIELIDDFQSLKKSGQYSDGTMEAIRTALIAQYDLWRIDVDNELRANASSGTEHPLAGVVGRFFASFFGLMIPALIVEASVSAATGQRTSVGVLVWGGGILAIVGFGIIKRIEKRDERLRQQKEGESKLRSRLDAVLSMSKIRHGDCEARQ